MKQTRNVIIILCVLSLFTMNISAEDLIYQAEREKTAKLVFVGGSACCNCVVDSVGILPEDFPESQVSSVTFYLLASRANSVYNQIREGATDLKLMLGDSQAKARTSKLPGETLEPVMHRWIVQFNFDPAVSVGPGTEWKLLDRDGRWQSAAIVHSSSEPSGGLKGNYVTKNCQYARTEAAWYSVKFDFSAVAPIPSEGLEIIKRNDYEFSIRLNGKEIYVSGMADVRIHKSYPNLGSYNVDVLYEYAGGNICQAFSYRVISWRSDGTHVVSDKFGNCSGPEIQQKGDRLTFFFKSYTGRISGEIFPAQTWEYFNGKLQQITTAPHPAQNFVYVDIEVFDPGRVNPFNQPLVSEGWDSINNLPSEFNLDVEVYDASGSLIPGGKQSIQFESNARGGAPKAIPSVRMGPLSSPPDHFRLALWENDDRYPKLTPGDDLIWSMTGEHCSFSKTRVMIHGSSYIGVEECKGSGDLNFSFNQHYAFRHKNNADFTFVNQVMRNAGPEYEKAYILVKVRK